MSLPSRNRCGWALAGAALLGLGACSPDAFVPDTRLVVGAEFVTLDGREAPPPEAMLIEQGRIAAFGPEDRLRARHPGVVVTDLSGRTVLPGFIDSHAHVRAFGLDAAKVDLTGAASVRDMVSRIRAQRPDMAAGAWIVGKGWGASALNVEGDEAPVDGPVGGPVNGLLNAAFRDNPVVMESLDGSATLANAAALRAAGITDDTPDPEGGTILRGPDGRATGLVLARAQDLLRAAMPAPDLEERKDAIVAGLERLAAAGITAVHELAMGAADVDAFRALADDGALPIRVVGYLDGSDMEATADGLAAGPLDDPLDRLDIRGIFVPHDGDLGPRTALLVAPYTDAPGSTRPAERVSLARIEALAEKAKRTGFQMAVQATGDAATDNVLGAFERRLAGSETQTGAETDAETGAETETGIGAETDHRWRIEGAQLVRRGFAARAAALGVVVSMQPNRAAADMAWLEARVGPRRIRRAHAWRDVLDGGARLVLNSGVPEGPWRPMQTLHVATTRTQADGTPPEGSDSGGWRPGQAVSREAALRAMTAGGAYVAFQEDTLGTLEMGKWADFVVLSDNPLTAPDVRDITVEATYVAGEPVGTSHTAG
ncbi:MAG: amidohydrolase [Pseudomonadota bacterium]